MLIIRFISPPSEFIVLIVYRACRAVVWVQSDIRFCFTMYSIYLQTLWLPLVSSEWKIYIYIYIYILYIYVYIYNVIGVSVKR